MDNPPLNFPAMTLANAEAQVADHQYAAGILLAQAAVEMAAWDAFTGLIARKIGTPVDDAVLGLVPDMSFMNRRTQAFWEWLTGKKITEPSEVWKAYREHVERRNRVAHGREWPDANHGQDARDSVAAARAFMDRMGTDVGRRRATRCRD